MLMPRVQDHDKLESVLLFFWFIPLGIAQVGLEFMAVLLSQPPEYMGYHT